MRSAEACIVTYDNGTCHVWPHKLVLVTNVFFDKLPESYTLVKVTDVSCPRSAKHSGKGNVEAHSYYDKYTIGEVNGRRILMTFIMTKRGLAVQRFGRVTLCVTKL